MLGKHIWGVRREAEGVIAGLVSWGWRGRVRPSEGGVLAWDGGEWMGDRPLPGPPGLIIVSSPRMPPQNFPTGHSGGELGQEGHC